MILAVTALCGLGLSTQPASADEMTEATPAPAPIQSPLQSTVVATQVNGRTLGGAINGSPGAGCTCRYKGRDVMLGQSICMKSGNGMVKARCSRYLNNTSWTITNTPCPIS